MDMDMDAPKMDTAISNKIMQYVHNNYKSYKGKNLLIEEFDLCYTIRREHEPNSSPLILSKLNFE